METLYQIVPEGMIINGKILCEYLETFLKNKNISLPYYFAAHITNAAMNNLIIVDGGRTETKYKELEDLSKAKYRLKYISIDDLKDCIHRGILSIYKGDPLYTTYWVRMMFIDHMREIVPVFGLENIIQEVISDGIDQSN